MKNSMGEKIPVYRNTKKDWNRIVSFHQITWNKFKCNDCGAEVSKTRVDSHENSHRPNKPKIVQHVTSTKDRVRDVTHDSWKRNWY